MLFIVFRRVYSFSHFVLPLLPLDYGYLWVKEPHDTRDCQVDP